MRHAPQLVCLLCLLSLRQTARAEDKPNVVLILVDDQGYYDLGCYGATEVKTPRIDALAAKGVRLTDYYAAAPICSPSRAGLLTGCYPRRVGNATWVHRADSTTGIHPDEITLAELFQANGYATACIGKWHLGFHKPFLPRQQGFDHYFGLLHNLDDVEVVYASDNGRGPGRNPQQPIQGRKLITYEGGIRVPAIAWGPGVGIRAGHESACVVHAMDWYPTLATLAGIEVPSGRVLDGRDLSDLLTGKTDEIPLPSAGSLNASLPMRRPWNPSAEWAAVVQRVEYQNAFFYHGSQGALAAVRSKPWKLFLNPKPTLYNLADDPGERKPVFNGQVIRKLRGMAVIFQEEMRRDARPAGEVSPGPSRGFGMPFSGRVAPAVGLRPRVTQPQEERGPLAR